MQVAAALMLGILAQPEPSEREELTADAKA